MSGKYESRKGEYDKINAGYESNRSALESVNDLIFKKVL